MSGEQLWIAALSGMIVFPIIAQAFWVSRWDEDRG